MKVGKTVFSPIVWVLVLMLILIGQNTRTQKPTTRAEDSPGFGILEQAKQLRSEEKFVEGFNKALEATELFRQDKQWELWGAGYEEAFQCALKSGPSNIRTLYEALFLKLTTASQLLSGLKDVPDKTQATIWRRLGSIQHHFGAYDQAATYYEKALPFAEHVADTVMLSRLYVNTGIVTYDKGDDYRALDYMEKALSLSAILHDTQMMTIVLYNLGNVWRTLDPPKSILIYRQALALDPKNTQTLMLLSKAYEKDLEKAFESANASLQHANSNEEKSDALHQIGRVYFAMKKYDLALSFFNQAYGFAVKGYGKQHPECVKINNYKGNVFLAKHDFKKALNAYNQTLDDLLPLFSPQNPDENPERSELTTTSLWILNALLGKAKVYEQLFYHNKSSDALVNSLECAELALYYQNKIKLRYGDDDSKFLMSEAYNASCEAALHSAFLLYKQSSSPNYAQRAFSISEQTKAVVLAEALYKKDMKQVYNVPSPFLEQERQSQEQIAFFEKKLTETAVAEQVAVIKDSLFISKRRLEVLDQQLQENYPAYAEALFSYRTDTPVDSVKLNLPDDAALLEYFLGDSALYTFLLTKDTFWVDEQALPKTFDQTASDFLHTINNWRFVADSSVLASKMFLDNSHQLYQWLLEKPLAVTKARRLFIVPDGKLGLIPFEILLTKPYIGQWIDRDVPFLLKERTISYRFSSRKQSQKRSDPEKGWGGFGLEYDDAPVSSIDRPDKTRWLRDYGPLPFADDEIMAIKNVMGGAFWLNHDATRENFLTNAEHYGILHLAMHGVVDERNPLRSRLLFSTSVSGGDPSVYASDLYNLQLQAGLSVLSACQSGTGVWKKGEGVMSLARAFAFAGCPSMVMSLWNVSDQSTSELMVSFYQQLKHGATKDEALRTAKLDYLRTASPEYAKPIYWASFVPIGEMNSLPDAYFSNGKGMLPMLLGAIVLLIFLIVAIIIRRSRRTAA